jgi:hypothetical protein
MRKCSRSVQLEPIKGDLILDLHEDKGLDFLEPADFNYIKNFKLRPNFESIVVSFFGIFSL